MEQTQEEVSDGEASDDGLKIVIETPKRRSPKKRKVPVNLDASEKQVIESVENELEQTLCEKASKTNLTVTNVKSLIREVAKNEHVLAMVRNSEKEEPLDTPYEPKITRAKAKQLFSSNNVIPLPWLSPTKPSSEVQKLITEDLAEDSSGDEYVPAEEESEDDPDSSAISESDISSPATPLKSIASPPPVNWTDDGMFKIPPVKTKSKTQEEEEETNIALRTRSKVNYSTTPLEILEEAFIPPDITTDMYDMECDDDVYKDFLRKFTRPLDEITKATEDEELDPEYNILADEEIDEIDTEELRADRAVKITRKEVNELMAELFEYANAFVEEEQKKNKKANMVIPQAEIQIAENSLLMNTTAEEQLQNYNQSDASTPNKEEDVSFANDSDLTFPPEQRLLLEQQIRQHIQLLTQNFILTYAHPEFHDSSIKFKEQLINFQFLADNNENSFFKAHNLDSALKFIEDWEQQFNLDTDEVKAAKQHVNAVYHQIKESHATGFQYIPTFPQLLLERVSKSEVFLYPALLPKIPFRPPSTYKGTIFIKPENELIALGMEQFTPFLAKDSHNLTYKGEVKLKNVCEMIVQYMMPMKDVNKLYCHIFNSKDSRREMNPIKYYFQNKKSPMTIHYVISLKEFGILPPCKRHKDLLPYQWKQFIYPESEKTSNSFTKVQKPPAFNKVFMSKNRRIAPKPASSTPVKNLNAYWRNKSVFTPINSRRVLYSSTPKLSITPVAKETKLENYFKSPTPRDFKNIKACVKCMKFNSSIFEKLRADMLPSMPFLGTSCGNKPDCISVDVVDNSKEKELSDNSDKTETESTINLDESTLVQRSDDSINTSSVSSNKSPNQKKISRAEKKKEKLLKERNATLRLLLPEDPAEVQEKVRSYAQAYFDKARECLTPEEFEQFMGIFNSFNEGTNTVTDLYKQMEVILGQKHEDLLEEFLTFLTPAQANDIGKLTPYFMLSNMSLFLRKLEIYFKEQPAQLRKIYRSLTDLASSVNTSMDRVKSTILPLLKGNNLLTDWFLQIFPSEPPPTLLLKGPWEYVDVRREISSNEDMYETVTIPEVEDPYGGPNCICSCHEKDNPLFKNRTHHCIPCSLKFLQGRVYIQTGKGLRLANVTFNNNPDVDHNSRLNCSSIDRKKRRSETSPSKQQTSPLKDQEEGRIDSEDDAECGKRKSRFSRSPRKKKIKLTEKLEKSEEPGTHTAVTPTKEPNLDQQSTLTKESPETPQECADTAKPAEEVTEWDCNTSIESVEIRHSPEHSAESESEFLEESSQDNINTETDDSAEEIESLSNSPIHSENSNSNTAEEMWTREQDKIILETLQKEGDKEDAFVRISEVLSNRSVAQIKERFQTLMSLLQKMASCSSTAL